MSTKTRKLTPRQVESNRQNAKKSTGPRSEAGILVRFGAFRTLSHTSVSGENETFGTFGTNGTKTFKYL